MILHGIYNNGRIKIKEKKLPKIKTEVDIILPEIVNEEKKEQLLKLAGTLKSDINGLTYQREIRKDWER